MGMDCQVRICKCGRIHFIERSVVTEAVEADKELLVICGGCGAADIIGADKVAENGNNIYMMYSFDFTEGEQKREIDVSSFETVEGKTKGLYKIIFDPGIKVMMMTGFYATHYDNAGFTDLSWPILSFLNKNPSAFTPEEACEEIKNHRRDMVTVNMKSLLSKLTEDEAECLSHYIINGLDWTETKYERR